MNITVEQCKQKQLTTFDQIENNGETLYRDDDGCVFALCGKTVVFLEGNVWIAERDVITFPVTVLRDSEKVVLTND